VGALSERRGSNPRPRPWQGRALPAELLSRSMPERWRFVDANIRGLRRLASTFSKKNLGSLQKTGLESDYESVKISKRTKKILRPVPASNVIRIADRKLACPLSRNTRHAQNRK
jgi:hypothetical protein